MAAFSYQYQPFLLDSIFMPNNPLKMPAFTFDDANANFNTNCNFSQFYPAPEQPVHHFPFHRDNEQFSVTKNQSSESSTLVDKSDSGEPEPEPPVVDQVVKITTTSPNNHKKRKSRNSSSTASSTQSKCIQGATESTGSGKKQKKEEDQIQKPKTAKKEEKLKTLEDGGATGYIHVRARRGQATDSHSLAERVRREKISERMKTLQRLVPGCDKVTGKALMLDEIINYVQSLQNQVEFLSMKLASLNPIFFDFRMDLDGLMIQPETSLSSSMSPQLPASMAQCNVVNVIPPPALVDTTTATTSPPSIAAVNNFPLIDHSANLFLFQQGQGLSPNAYSHHQSSHSQQDNVKASSSWDVEDQRRKLLISSGIIGDNLCYFH